MSQRRTEDGRMKSCILECRFVMLLLLGIAFHFPLSIFHLQAQTAIGKWRDCLDYSRVLYVAPAGDCVYAGARGGVFCYDLEYLTVQPMSKSSGLSDVGIAALAYDDVTRCLVVGYTNSNVDIVSNGHVYNLSDIKRSEIPGNKKIYHIRFHGGKAYLATGFGVVVVDLAKREIRETWYLGEDGTYMPVYDLAFSSDSIYAATERGLRSIDIGDSHPSVSPRWTIDHRMDGVSLTTLDTLNGRLLLADVEDDTLIHSLYVATPMGYRLWNRGKIRSMHVGGGLVTLARDECVVRYNRNLELYDSLPSYTWGPLRAHDAVTTADGTLWVGHDWDGLIRVTSSGDDTHKPVGPFSSDNVYRLVPFNYRMMLCPGGHTTTYRNVFISPNILTASGGEWHGLDLSNGLLDNCSDLLDVAVNPMDTTEMVAALWGSGLAQIRDSKVQTLYTDANTGGALHRLESGNYTPLRTGAVAFDRSGNLWALVSSTTHSLAVRKTDGSWQGFPTTFKVGEREVAVTNLDVDHLVWDSVTDYKWFFGRDNRIYVHDGKNKMAWVNPNNGSKGKGETSEVNAMVQDQSGNLWVGTDKGIKVIYDGYNAFQRGGNGEESPVTCSNITITNGEFSEYLMFYENITAIAVDGANRKWVGTSNGGIYLISSNGMEQLEHFTAANSPLFSDKVVSIGINERSGEVYVGTDRGLQVFRGTATYAVSVPQKEVYAFPNPVRPDYDGPIAIKGFSRNAVVHITDAAGHTVYSTTANGGQAIWNARTQNGERVASGVYYVFAADSMGDNRAVAKILIVR